MTDQKNIGKPLILLGFSFLQFYLVISGRIRMYINPHFAILNEITAVVLLAMFAVQLFYSRNTSSLKWGAVIFIVPLALAFLLPDAALDARAAANRGLNFNSSINSAQPGSGEQVPVSANGTDNTGISKSGTIQVTTDNFVRVVDALDQSPESYTGREIDMLGFVMREQDLAPHEFGLIRFIIAHCTADATPGGLIAESKDVANYKDGTWIDIQGAIGLDSYDQQVVPVIEATSVRRAAQPQDPYVYP